MTIRRTLLGVAATLAAALVLTGCAANAQDERPAASDGTRTVEHVFGSTEIASTDRVAVLDGDRTMEAVVALGIQPVAAVKPPLTGNYAQGVAEALDTEPANLAGAEGEVDYEALLAAEPNLVIMHVLSDADREMYNRASEIAPTVAITYTAAGWRDTLNQTAIALDREAQADELLAAYDAALAETDDVAGVDGETLSVVRVRSDHVRYMTYESSFPWSVLKELGYTAPETQESGDDGTETVTVSLENIDLLVADRVLVLVDAGTDDAVNDLLADPLFADAEVTKLPSSDFLFGNVLTAQRMLDDFGTV
ncbi:hypothetical protein BJH93_15715 [Kocuria polaris]|nr:hypothetical protein [Kocuria polaris]